MSSESNMTPDRMKKIMESSLKEELKHNNGDEYVAYLYADDEKLETDEYATCSHGDPQKYTSRTGDYFLYLYNKTKHIFSSKKVKVFSGFHNQVFGVDGAYIIVMHDENNKKSDALLITQFIDCNTDAIEAYGFSKDGVSLEQYDFINEEEGERYNIGKEFSGRISSSDEGETVIYTQYGEDTAQFWETSPRLSDRSGELILKLENKSIEQKLLR